MMNGTGSRTVLIPCTIHPSPADRVGITGSAGHKKGSRHESGSPVFE